MNDFSQIRVGVSLMVVKDDSAVLLGRRKGSHGEGEYEFPGGHVEYGETVLEAIYRELEEEVGDSIKTTRPVFLCAGDLLCYLPKQYLDICFVAEWISGEPEVMEPHKIESWNWYEINNIPEPQFATLPYHLEAYETGRKFFTAR